LKPTGVGEFITEYDTTGYINAQHIFWQGTFSRGLRYINFSDIRPYTLEWAWTDTIYPKEKANLRNSFNPVALFDKSYDSLGIAPFVDSVPGCYPTIIAGSNVTRKLILYNDDFSNDIVEAEVTIKSDGQQYASGIISYQLALGSHMDIAANFQVPAKGGNIMELELSTYKSGVMKFQESKFFNISGNALGATSSNVTFFPNSGISLLSAEISQTGIYPNPAFQIIYIPVNLPQGETTVLNIFNSDGKLIDQKQINNGVKIISLNVEDYPSGLYIYSYNNTRGKFIVK